MIVFAILGTLAAAAFSLMVLWANAMRSSPGDFYGRGMLTAAWLAVLVFWLAWWVG